MANEPVTHEQAQTVFLHAIVKQLARMVPVTFALDVVVDNAGTSQRLGGTKQPGVVRCVHNPSAAAVTLTITDGMATSAAPALFNAQLAAGESREVFLPFGDELVASSGTGCRLYGEYRRP